MKRNYILKSAFLLALCFGCNGLRNEEAVKKPLEKIIETTTWDGFRMRIYKGTLEHPQAYRTGDDANPIQCISEEDFWEFAKRGEYAIHIR